MAAASQSNPSSRAPSPLPQNPLEPSPLNALQEKFQATLLEMQKATEKRWLVTQHRHYSNLYADYQKNYSDEMNAVEEKMRPQLFMSQENAGEIYIQLNWDKRKTAPDYAQADWQAQAVMRLITTSEKVREAFLKRLDAEKPAQQNAVGGAAAHNHPLGNLPIRQAAAQEQSIHEKNLALQEKNARLEGEKAALEKLRAASLKKIQDLRSLLAKKKEALVTEAARIDLNQVLSHSAAKKET